MEELQISRLDQKLPNSSDKLSITEERTDKKIGGISYNALQNQAITHSWDLFSNLFSPNFVYSIFLLDQK